MRRWLAAWVTVLLVITLTAGASAAPLTPSRARSVVITVVGIHGEPLEGSAVQVMMPGTDRFQIAQTNAKGEALLALTDGFSFWIRAWSDGHAVVERPYVPSTDGPVVTLVATPYRASLVGIVTDEKGRAVKDARVTVWLTNLGLQATAATGADGAYEISGLQARDTYIVQTEARGFQPFVQTDVVLTAGARNQVDARLTPSAGPVTGEVVDSLTSLPAGDIAVELILNGWGVVDRTVTDSFGYFFFAAAPWGESAYQVRLSASGRETYTSNAFAVNAGAWVNFTGANRISLNPLFGELSGSVLDQSGQALANTPVELQRSGLGTIEKAVTDESGFFAFANLPAGTYRVRALPVGDREHGASAWVAVSGGDKATADVAANTPDMTSFGASAIVGTVADHLGNPVSGAKVTATRGTTVIEATTDAKGRYRLGVDSNIESGVDPETSSGYHVAVSKDGYIPTDLQEAADDAPPPAMVDVRYKATNRANFTLQPSTATVAGRVLNDRGLPVPGVAVALVPEGSGTARRAVTDGTGRYRFADLPVTKQTRYLPMVDDGHYFASSMTPDGGLIDPVTLQPGGVLTHSLTVRPRTVDVHGAVKAGTDLPAAGAAVTLVSPSDGTTFTSAVAESGTYSLSLPAVPGRQYLVRAAQKGATDGTNGAALNIGANYGAVVNLTVVPDAAIIGRVYSPDGKPSPATEVALWAEGEKEAVAVVAADAEGYYRFSGLTPGRRYSVAVWWGINTWSTLAPGEAILTPLLSPGPGSTIRADLQAPAGKSGQ